MPAVTIEIPETLSQQLGPYRDNLDDLLWIGLNEVRKEQALALFKRRAWFTDEPLHLYN